MFFFKAYTLAILNEYAFPDFSAYLARFYF